MTDKPRILWLSDSGLLPTGYANVTVNVLNRLAERGWDCHSIGHNYLGQPLAPGTKFLDGNTLKFTLWGRGREDFAKDVIVSKIRELKPDIFVTLLDTFMVFPWFLELDFAPATSAFYFPSDGGEQLPSGGEAVLHRVSVPIAMSQFAQRQAKEVHGIDARCIQHGVDTNHFRKWNVKKRRQAKDRFGLRGRYVVGVVARNQNRKMLDRALKAFEKFCRGKDDAVLLLHTDPQDPAATFDLFQLINRLKLNNRVFFTGTRFSKGFTYDEMPGVYNAMDCFLLTTSGEGWGIPTVEAMSCGVPVIVSDYTTTKEIVADHEAGLTIDVTTEWTGGFGVERGIVDIDVAASCLDTLYNDQALRERLGKNGRKAAVNHFDWDKVIIPQWIELLESLL